MERGWAGLERGWPMAMKKKEETKVRQEEATRMLEETELQQDEEKRGQEETLLHRKVPRQESAGASIDRRRGSRQRRLARHPIWRAPWNPQ